MGNFDNNLNTNSSWNNIKENIESSLKWLKKLSCVNFKEHHKVNIWYIFADSENLLESMGNNLHLHRACGRVMDNLKISVKEIFLFLLLNNKSLVDHWRETKLQCFRTKTKLI